MKFRSFHLIIILYLTIIQGCQLISKDKVIIDGTFANIPETQLFLYQIQPEGKTLIDSLRTDASGNFKISFLVKSPGYFILNQNAANEISLVISPGERITLSGNGKLMRDTYTVKGSIESELYSEYEKFTSANLDKVDSLSKVFTGSRSDPDFISIKNSLDSAYMKLFNKQKEEVISFINAHPGSLSALLIITNNFGPNPILTEESHPDLFLKLDSSLQLTYPGNSLVTPFHTRMIDLRAEQADSKAHDELLKPGLPAPEIILPNASGVEISLSSCKGKLTLVYFWSSWNAPSRQNNMNLTSIYTRYHDHGFDIYAVSVDSDSDLWKKSYMLDKAYWIQVNDRRGLSSEYCKTYSVRAIPKMILISKEGKIISNQLEFQELDNLIKSNL
jgi:hypothetical protein